MDLKTFLYRLFFTRDDDLDLLQLFFAILIVFFMVTFVLDGVGTLKVSGRAWTVFGSVFGILAICGTPTWIAKLLANAKMPGDISRAIASAGDDPGVSSDIQELYERKQKTANTEEIG